MTALKKWILGLCALLALLLAPVLSRAGEALSIVAVNFPCYDLARSLTGGLADVHMLLPPGSESHSYEPSPRDMIAIQNADLFVCTGGESDHWIETLLESLRDEAPASFRLTDWVTLLDEEHSQSMEAEREHNHGEMDEHVWTSPKNMMRIAPAFTRTLTSLRPESAPAYTAALEGYLSELKELDALFSDIVANGKRDLIVFGDRFPFRYFAADYGLAYDAAFPGCSEDSEPSVRTVISLVDAIRAQQIPVVFYIEFSSRRTADILAEETGAKPLLFHSCHNVSAEEMAAGATYLSLMQKNAQALKEALD